MARKRREKIDQFEAVDENGRVWTVEEFVDLIESRSRAGSEWVPGMRSLRTSNGLTVSPDEDDEELLIIVQLDLRLRRRGSPPADASE